MFYLISIFLTMVESTLIAEPKLNHRIYLIPAIKTEDAYLLTAEDFPPWQKGI